MTHLSDEIKQRIEKDCSPKECTVRDDSHLHHGHAGNTGGGHFFVYVVADCFEGLSAVQRHRMIYGLFSKDIPHRIHALSLELLTPSECLPQTNP